MQTTANDYIHPAMRRKLMTELRQLYSLADSLGGLPIANAIRAVLVNIRGILVDGLTADDQEMLDESARDILGSLLDDLDLDLDGE